MVKRQHRIPLNKTHPELLTQWHPIKNGELSPEQVTQGSNKHVWWACPNGTDHEWQAAIYSRTSGRGCPFCRGLRVSVTNSLNTLHPGLVEQWHPTKNGDLTPHMVASGSHQKAWWKCVNGPDHEWQIEIGSRTTGGNGCPFCAGKRVSVTNSLETKRPEIAAEWHPTKNDSLTPIQIVCGSNKKVWWACPNGPDHEWQSAVTDRTSGGNGCPFCSGYRASVTNSVSALYPTLASQWHPSRNGDLTP
jgi:hypothetical protein